MRYWWAGEERVDARAVLRDLAKALALAVNDVIR